MTAGHINDLALSESPVNSDNNDEAMAGSRLADGTGIGRATVPL
jgi:hypothetical protein